MNCRSRKCILSCSHSTTILIFFNDFLNLVSHENVTERIRTELFKGCSHGNEPLASVNIFLPGDKDFLSSPLSFSIFMRKRSYCLEF